MTRRAASEPIQFIASATNAENSDDTLDADKLYVKEIYVNEGPTSSVSAPCDGARYSYHQTHEPRYMCARCEGLRRTSWAVDTPDWFRLGVIRTGAPSGLKRKYAAWLHEDIKIRNYIKLYKTGISRVEIERLRSESVGKPIR